MYMKIYNLYFSPTGNTERIANYFSDCLKVENIDLTKLINRDSLNIEKDSLCILSIPTYSQSIPRPLRKCLAKIKSQYVVLNITYGGMSYGNMIYELRQRFKDSIIIGYSITPVTHSYLLNPVYIDLSKYDEIINRIRDKVFIPVKIKFKFKNIFARFFEKARTKYNYKIKYIPNLCTHCNKCIDNCPVNAIDMNHAINNECIRCGKCVLSCSSNALTNKLSFPLRLYLNKKVKTNVIVR